MIKWEYSACFLSLVENKNVEVLNIFGKEGWELTSIDSDRHTAYFKRSITEQ